MGNLTFFRGGGNGEIVSASESLEIVIRLIGIRGSVELIHISVIQLVRRLYFTLIEWFKPNNKRLMQY